MNGFVKYLAKFAVIFSIVLAVLLVAVVGSLIFIPEILTKIIYYGLILVCLVVAIGIIVSIIRCFIKRPEK